MATKKTNTDYDSQRIPGVGKKVKLKEIYGSTLSGKTVEIVDTMKNYPNFWLVKSGKNIAAVLKREVDRVVVPRAKK
jgi:hypothetical protein